MPTSTTGAGRPAGPLKCVPEVSGLADCIFCKIANKEIETTVVYEDDVCLAFEDANPQAPVHVLVIPKRHIASLADAGEDDTELLGRLCLACDKVAAAKGIREDGYRVVANRGAKAGQSVFHLHLHVLGGRAMNWPPG